MNEYIIVCMGLSTPTNPDEAAADVFDLFPELEAFELEHVFADDFAEAGEKFRDVLAEMLPNWEWLEYRALDGGRLPECSIQQRGNTDPDKIVCFLISEP